jgi:hypothetical protein
MPLLGCGLIRLIRDGMQAPQSIRRGFSFGASSRVGTHLLVYRLSRNNIGGRRRQALPHQEEVRGQGKERSRQSESKVLVLLARAEGLVSVCTKLLEVETLTSYQVLFLLYLLSARVLNEPETLLRGCRDSHQTSELLTVLEARWEEWSVNTLTKFWPQRLEASGSPEIYRWRGRLVGGDCQCCDFFFFQEQAHSNELRLERVKIVFSAESRASVMNFVALAFDALKIPSKDQLSKDDQWTILADEDDQRAYMWSEPKGTGVIQVEANVAEQRGVWSGEVEYTRFPRGPL